MIRYFQLSLFPLRLLLLPVCIVLTKIPIISPWTDRMALSTLTSEKFWHYIALHYQQKYLYFPFLFLLRQISIWCWQIYSLSKIFGRLFFISHAIKRFFAWIGIRHAKVMSIRRPGNTFTFYQKTFFWNDIGIMQCFIQKSTIRDGGSTAL